MRNTIQRQTRFAQAAPLSQSELAGTQGGVLPVALAVAYSGAITGGLIAGVTAGWIWCEKKFGSK